MPDVEDGLDNSPAGFDHVSALEERGVASHAVAEEALVTGAVLGAEVGVVVKIHVDEAETHDGAGNFGTEAEGDSFLGLDMNDHAVGFYVLDGGVAKEDERCPAELDDNFGGTLGKSLAGAEVEGNASPAPVVDLEFYGDESFSVGLRIDVGLAAIAGDRLAAHLAFAILAAEHAGEDFLGAERLDGVEDFGLFVADFIGVEGDGRFHGGHGKELEKMVGNHVAESAGGFIEAAAMLDPDGFGGGNLDMVDVMAVPERFDDVVGEAEDHDVLDRLFAEVMVDAVDLLFGEDLLEVVVELDSGLQVVAKRLFNDDASPLAVFFLGHAGSA